MSTTWGIALMDTITHDRRWTGVGGTIAAHNSRSCPPEDSNEQPYADATQTTVTLYPG